ncbi:aldehyde dehydrogenase family protein [Sphingobium sp. TB-6]|uniref:aldehyde dehydrogenase family protein n=1 Tax=Sphingobium sp. TB-6 TaxID=2728850 RepID=UPI00146DA3C3|nr:aldehyde dehydrogenase family protein [Sphingobium sp. TB-6]NML90664.1 aldehyde dehydrogenase family protein [Sphingobium sp. TB-6]
MQNFDSDYRMLIDGRLVTTPKTFEVYNPATEEVIANAPEAGRDQLEEAVAAARRAFPAWRDTPLAERQRIVAAIGAVLDAHAEELMHLLTREQGKPRAGAQWEIGGSSAWCHALAEQALDTETIEEGDGRRVEMRRVPLGVVGAITPWNFPVLLAIWKIAPALVAGNTIVLKPSPYTPLCTLKLGELLKDVVPAGVLNIITGGNDLGAWMTSHDLIDKISFTGSTATGRKVMESAAANVKRITLELGGNDPAIVLPDVDPKTIAPQLFWAAFQNSSQFCAAAKRLYIHDDVYDLVRDELVAYARTVKVGDGSQQGTQLGPIQNRMQFEKLKDLLADTRRLGVDIPVGGEAMDGPGFFIPVTIVDNPPDDSRIVREEPFGPVLPLLRFKDIDDVIARANDTEYGLAASIWSADVEQAKRIAERIQAGTVWINEIHVFAPHIAFGGHKQSGLGVENSLHGLAEYTNLQTITSRKLAATA